ncbi:Rieske (2Fe-2S) protein [Streptomyces caeni]|uniref:Rieske (2Fe-2S) protein n=1 Tax=Streptomyces caeni TaxID=2307231 RepID=A0ABW4IQS3_9ACTN
MVLATGNTALASRLGRIADERNLSMSRTEPVEGQPAVAVLDIDEPDAVETVRGWRGRWPDSLIAGFSAVPDPGRWVEAQRAGCDLVVNRGALPLRLAARLAEQDAEGRGSRRFVLFEAADAAGRLGLVFRTGDSPVGPLAVYRLGGRLYAVADRCPHAGAALSQGEVEGTVVTCPGHGSQFDLCTGERVRGPSDTGIDRFTLVQEGGQVFLVLR